MSKTVTCKDVFGNEYEADVQDLQQRVGVYAVIIKERKILLTRQWNGYSLVGGGVDNGENLEDAFTREVKEETGLEAVPGELFHHATTYFKKDEASVPFQSFQFYFTCKSIEGEINNVGITNSENSYTDAAAEWIDLNTAQDIKLRHSVDLKTILTAYNRSRGKDSM